MEQTNPSMKKCPFCGEQILREAIKCRFCGEFLEPRDQASKTNPVDPSTGNPPAPASLAGVDTDFFFEGSPSLAALLGTFLLAAVLLAAAVFVGYFFRDNYGVYIGLAVGGAVILALCYKILVFKSTIYRVTSDRIEFEEGILSKRIDNLDLYRIVDLDLTQTLLDRIVGIGTIKLVTTDQNQPQCELYKIRNPRQVFEVLKKANLTADRRRGVFHVE